MSLIDPDQNKAMTNENFFDYKDGVSKCYTESDASLSFQPLEICGIPYSYVQTVMDYR
jgi:hypothetical protein